MLLYSKIWNTSPCRLWTINISTLTFLFSEDIFLILFLDSRSFTHEHWWLLCFCFELLLLFCYLAKKDHLTLTVELFLHVEITLINKIRLCIAVPSMWRKKTWWCTGNVLFDQECPTPNPPKPAWLYHAGLGPLWDGACRRTVQTAIYMPVSNGNSGARRCPIPTQPQTNLCNQGFWSLTIFITWHP